MSQYWQELLLVAALIVANGFFAAAEIAVIATRPLRIREMAEEGHPSARLLLRLMEDKSRFLATIQVGITLAGFLASASAAVGIAADLGVLLQGLGLPPAAARSAAVLVITLAISYLTLVLGELVPKRLALQTPESLALLLSRPIYWISRAAAPFTALLTGSTNLVMRLLGRKVHEGEPDITEEELRAYVAEHRDLEEEEKRLIEGVFDFGDRLVRQLMVPRPEMDAIHQDTPLPQVLDHVRQAGFWRYPVYNRDHDDIVGIVTVKDLIYHLSKASQHPTPSVSSIMRPARFVPETKRALELLKEMQQADEQMVMVVDEYGGVAGLVTLEDLLQEIVGDVADAVPLDAAAAGPTEMVIDAMEPIDEVNERLGAQLPQSPHYETLAGYILHTLGALPEEGAEVRAPGWILVVERMEGHRIDRVRAIRLPEPGAEETPAGVTGKAEAPADTRSTRISRNLETGSSDGGSSTGSGGSGGGDDNDGAHAADPARSTKPTR